MNAGKRVAYIKRGLFSYSNVRTGEQLRRVFPGYEVEEIDIVADFLRQRKSIVLQNAFHMLRLYGPAIVARRLDFRLCFYRTPYIFHQIRRFVREHLEKRRAEFAFTFQTQSLYDASVPGIPHFVYTDHAHLTNLLYPGFDRRELFARSWIDLEREIYHNAGHVFVMSEHVKDSLRDSYQLPSGKCSCVFAGSNVDTRPVAQDNQNFTNRTVIFVGVDWHRKGGPTLVEAFKKVLVKMPDARLVIVGSKPRIQHPNIEVLGRVSHEEVKAQLARASVFCLPTRVEPFGIAVVEAFYHQLPVVVSNIGAMPQIVEHGKSGLLVKPDDAAALSESLLQLLADPDKCRRFAEHGANAARARFSWDAVGNRIGATISETLEPQFT